MPASAGEGFEAFNVFDVEYDETSYHGARNHIRVVNRSPDGRHMTFAGGLPDGVKFHQPAGNVKETFYIVRGEITCTLADGSMRVWKEGDLVYWPYEEPMDLEYSPGLLCICFFWSDEPLPNFGEPEVHAA